LPPQFFSAPRLGLRVLAHIAFTGQVHFSHALLCPTLPLSQAGGETVF
jgi:hypothetical protein